jgi:hypothetical protein
MGYTNYWKQHTDIPDEVWDLIRKEIEYLIEFIGDGCLAVWHILTYTSHLLGTNFEISRDE